QGASQGTAQLSAHIAVPAPGPSGAAKPLTPFQPGAAAGAAPVACVAPTELVHFEQPLVHTMRQLANGQPLTVVPIGSSSGPAPRTQATRADLPSNCAGASRAGTSPCLIAASMAKRPRI